MSGISRRRFAGSPATLIMSQIDPYEPSSSQSGREPAEGRVTVWRFTNPKPHTRAWWISWSCGILFFGTLALGALFYVDYSNSVAHEDGNRPAVPSAAALDAHGIDDPFTRERERVAVLLNELERLNRDASNWEAQWIGESYEASVIRGFAAQPRQDDWGYTHSRKSRSDKWGFRIVFVPKPAGGQMNPAKPAQ
jgi:hypothetical protein